MSRIQLLREDQTLFFDRLKKKSNRSWEDLGSFLGVSGRTLHDWQKGKYTVPEKIVYTIHRKFRIPLPRFKKILDDHWYVLKGAYQGAMRRQELYGPVATPEGRKKGGQISQQRRKEDPEKYRALGCMVRKDFPPLYRTEALAEIVGIILGDGAITNTQVRISLDRKVDRAYAVFVSKLMHSVFHEKPSWTERENVITLTISGMDLVNALESIGMRRGDKVAHQVGIPSWIYTQINFQKACVRGLMDTDGGVYFHHHVSGGYRYRSFGLSFGNHSTPLITGVDRILRRLKFNVKQYQG